MIALLPQISGAIAGGLVGGFSGFIVNVVHERLGRARTRHNVAGALVGEIEGLCEHIKLSSLATDDRDKEGIPAYALFRGERDYNPIYRSMGVNFGLLSAPLPRDLVNWHVTLAMCLERAHEIHELARARERDPVLDGDLAEVAQYQRRAFADLLARAEELVVDLSQL